MYKCDYRQLRLIFSEFHGIEKDEMPEEDEFCLLVLNDGSYTAGKWTVHEIDEAGKPTSCEFVRGTFDSNTPEEVSKWHSLERYDLKNCLEDEITRRIRLGVEEGISDLEFKDFKSLRDGDFPQKEQYCLLILMDGRLSAGRWTQWREAEKGYFIYAPVANSHSIDEVWAWTPLSSDRFFEQEQEKEREREYEEELNGNPSIDHNKFIYGTDVSKYYEKALEKLRKDYPWATLAQMKKKKLWEIVPLHGQYVFGQRGEDFDGKKIVTECEQGGSAAEFIDFLCEYTKYDVLYSNPEEKFKYGLDIEVYLDKAYEKVKKDCRWLDKKMLGKVYHYEIRQIDGENEFVRVFNEDKKYFVCNYRSADHFIECLESEFQSDALSANPVVAEYQVHSEGAKLGEWYLERYVFSKLETGDYKVYVQAGDRSAGGGREFFITPYCFEAKSYEEFLDRYLEIVPGGAFGLFKSDLLPNEELKSFLGY